MKQKLIMVEWKIFSTHKLGYIHHWLMTSLHITQIRMEWSAFLTQNFQSLGQGIKNIQLDGLVTDSLKEHAMELKLTSQIQSKLLKLFQDNPLKY